MLTYDDLTWTGGLVFDDLDDTAVTVYDQSADFNLHPNPNSSQGNDEIWSQELDVQLDLIPGSVQEYVSPASAQAYTQGSTARLISYLDAFQEHIGVGAGEFGQSGNVVVHAVFASTQSYTGEEGQTADIYITVTFNSLQEFFDPAGTTLYEQAGDLFLAFPILSLHDWEDPFTGPSGYSLQQNIIGIVEGSTPFPIVAVPALAGVPTLFYVKFISSSPEWLQNEGLAGEPVGVELLLDGVVVGAMTPDQDHLTIQPHIQPAFNDMYDALSVGEAAFSVRGFERFSQYSLSQQMTGESLLRIRAYY